MALASILRVGFDASAWRMSREPFYQVVAKSSGLVIGRPLDPHLMKARLGQNGCSESGQARSAGGSVPERPVGQRERIQPGPGDAKRPICLLAPGLDRRSEIAVRGDDKLDLP